jgi:phosphatidylglycerol---prolipoprotein diacylglyceryl transferase
MISSLYWNPDPKIFTLPFFNFPILWYGIFFALGFWFAFRVVIQIFIRYFPLISSAQTLSADDLKNRARELTDRLTVYIVIGTILGARLGHFLFYEQPAHYLADPLEFFRFRNGGLASHGAIVGIIAACVLFSYRIRDKYKDLTWMRILDFIAVPTPLAGACIRVGNFFNQEILGTPTHLPWAVVFGHPADGSAPLPRHPAQLYEALWYLAVFFILWRLSKKPSFLLKPGKLVGLFLILAFLFRFLIEFLKLEQSNLLSFSYLTMGQILSIPAILLGIIFYVRNHSKFESPNFK